MFYSCCRMTAVPGTEHDSVHATYKLFPLLILKLLLLVDYVMLTVTIYEALLWPCFPAYPIPVFFLLFCCVDSNTWKWKSSEKWKGLDVGGGVR